MIGIVIILSLITLAIFKRHAVSYDRAVFGKDNTVQGLVHAVLWLILPRVKALYKYKMIKNLYNASKLLYDASFRDIAVAIVIANSVLLPLVCLALTDTIYSILKNDYLAFYMLVFSIFSIAFPYALYKRRRQSKSQRILSALPSFLQQISLLIKSGTTVEKAISIVKKSSSGDEGIDEMLKIVYRERDKGLAIYQSFSILTEMIYNKSINHLAVLMTQVPSTGVHRFAEQLLELSDDMLQERQALVRRFSEQLSTKLLLPMMVSMAAIMMLLVYPIFLQL